MANFLHSNSQYQKISHAPPPPAFNQIHDAPPSYDSHRFQSSGCRDAHWAFLFLGHLLTVIGVGSFYFYRYRAIIVDEIETSSSSVIISYPLLLLLASAIMLSLIISLLYFMLMRFYPSQLIKFTQYLSIAMMGFVVISSLLSGNVGSALISGLFLALQIWWFSSVKDRIEFSAMLLETASEALKTFYGTFIIAIIGMIGQIIWFTLWLLCAAAIYQEITTGLSHSSYDRSGHYRFNENYVNCILILLLLSLYWTSMLISYIVHATIAGVMGVWYFLYPQTTPKYPTFESLKRAMTTSLGSLSLAALILAVIKTLRAIVQIVSNQRAEDQQRSLMSDIAIGCADCFLSILDSLISYINLYSITRIALYGESFYTASDRSLTLLKSRGLDAVINDSLINTALTMGALTVGFLTALLTALVAAIWLPSTESLSVIGVSSFAFLIAFALSSTALGSIEAAIMALFICLAEDPNALYSSKPDVYERIVSSISARYPQCHLDGVSEIESGGSSSRHYSSYGSHHR